MEGIHSTFENPSDLVMISPIAPVVNNMTSPGRLRAANIDSTWTKKMKATRPQNGMPKKERA